jgi:hypothetical protein
VTSFTAKLPKFGRFNQQLAPNGAKFSIDFSAFAPPLVEATPAKTNEKGGQ